MSRNLETVAFASFVAVLASPLALAAERGREPSAASQAWDLLKDGEWGQAVVPLRKAAEEDKDNALWRYALGVSLGNLGELDPAVEELKRAIGLDPSYPDAWHYLRTLWTPEAQAGSGEPIKYFEKAARKHPEGHAHIHLNLGILLAQSGRAEDAHNAFDRAMNIAPGCAEARLRAGIVELEMGRATSAAGHIRKALELVPDYAEAHATLALALEKEGKPDAAQEVREHEQAALRLKPELAGRLRDARLAAKPKLTLRGRGPEEDLLAPLSVLMLPVLGVKEIGPFLIGGRPERPKEFKLPKIPPGPREFALHVRIGGQRLLGPFFDTPNVRVMVTRTQEGKVRLETRIIPDSRVRFDPVGTVALHKEAERGETVDIGPGWRGTVREIGPEEVHLLIQTK